VRPIVKLGGPLAEAGLAAGETGETSSALVARVACWARGAAQDRASQIFAQLLLRQTLQRLRDGAQLFERLPRDRVDRKPLFDLQALGRRQLAVEIRAEQLVVKFSG
jgi:hypothetical protein